MADVVNRIVLKLEKEGATASSKEYFAGERQRQRQSASSFLEAEKIKTKQMKEEAAKRAAADKETRKAEAAAAKQAAKDSIDAAKQAAREKTAAERKAFQDWKQLADLQHKLTMQAWDQQRKAQEENKNSLSEIGSALAGLGLGFSGLSVAKKGFQDITEGALESAQRIQEMAENFIKLRDAGRELAGVMGQKPTTKATQEQLDFTTKTGQTGDEARDFRLSFRGEAQQFKDRFAPGEFEKFEIAAARLQVKEGLEAGVSGKIAAGAIRTLPKNQKDLTADQVLAPLAEGFQTLQGGSGSNPVLANQFAQVISGGIGPEGQFKDHKEAAVAVRTQAQYNDADAGMHTRAIQRGINQLDDSQAAALGLNDKQNFFEQMEAIRAAYKKSGIKKLSKFLDKAGFSDERTRVGIETHINEGIEGGVVDAGFKDANKFNLGQYKADTNEFYTAEDQPGAIRVSQAKTAAKEGQLARNRVLIAKTLEDAKRANLPFNSSAGGQAINKLANTFTTEAYIPGTGYKDAEEMQLYGRAVSMAEGRARAAGVNVGPSMLERNAIGVRGFVGQGKDKTEELIARLVTLAEKAEKQREEQIKKAEPPPRAMAPAAPVRLPARP